MNKPINIQGLIILSTMTTRNLLLSLLFVGGSTYVAAQKTAGGGISQQMLTTIEKAQQANAGNATYRALTNAISNADTYAGSGY